MRCKSLKNTEINLCNDFLFGALSERSTGYSRVWRKSWNPRSGAPPKRSEKKTTLYMLVYWKLQNNEFYGNIFELDICIPKNSDYISYQLFEI